MFDLAQLREEQKQLADQIECMDKIPSVINYIAGADVGFEEKMSITRGTIVILSYPSFELVEQQVVKVKTTFPYIPGFLSYRECPALLQAWERIDQKPDLMLVDGQGIAHPRSLGVASHLGLLTKCPTIGVAKSKLCGDYAPVGNEQGSTTPLVMQNRQIGWVLRSKLRCLPLFLSPGYGVSMASTLLWTTRCLQGYRLPEPTRLADKIASRRNLYNKV